MNQQAVPFLRPESSVKAGYIPQQRRPEQAVSNWARPRFDHVFFFTLMQIVEYGHNGLHLQPEIEETRTVPGSERLNALVEHNEMLIRDIVRRVGGLPVRMQLDDQHGKITEMFGLADGKWKLEFQSVPSGEKTVLSQSTQEIQDAFLATLPINSTEQS